MPQIIYLDLTQQENARYVKHLITQYPTAKQYACYQSYLINPNAENEQLLSLKQTLMPFRKPPETLKPEKRALNYHYYAVVEDHACGAGAFGCVRPVLGVWKIGHGTATYKVKPSEKKQRFLKSLFFKKPVEMAQEQAIQEGKKSPLNLYLIKQQVIKNAINSFIHEQQITNLIPHMSAPYPLIETEDGVHFLMRKQRGMTLETWITWMEQNPQGLTLIQRLLLCINLYEALETQVHAITLRINAENHAPLIHRDIKPTNIMVRNKYLSLSSKIIDYGLSDYRGYLSATPVGTPLYMDPQLLEQNAAAQESDDLFGIAVICMQIWGDKQRHNIQTWDELRLKNRQMQFKGLFSKMTNCSAEQKIAITSILQHSTHFKREDRWTNRTIINAYLNQLLLAYERLKTNNLALKTRLVALQASLPNYKELTKKARKLLNQEFIAIDCLIAHAEQIDQHKLINTQNSLASIWSEYRDTQLGAVNNTTLPADTPTRLQDKMKRLRTACAWPLPPNANMLHIILADWQVVRRLSALFQQLKFIDTNILTSLYNKAFLKNNPHRTLVELEIELRTLLDNYLKALLPISSFPTSVQQYFLTLCQQTMDLNIVKSQSFRNEFYHALNIANLKILLTQSGQYEPGQLKFLLAQKNSFSWAFDQMYLKYQTQLLHEWQTALQPYLSNTQSTGLLGFLFPANPQHQRRSTALFKELDELFQQYQYSVASLPQAIVWLMNKVIAQENEAHQQGYLGSIGLTSSPFANTLQTLLDDFRQQHHLVDVPNAVLTYTV